MTSEEISAATVRCSQVDIHYGKHRADANARMSSASDDVCSDDAITSPTAVAAAAAAAAAAGSTSSGGSRSSFSIASILRLPQTPEELRHNASDDGKKNRALYGACCDTCRLRLSLRFVAVYSSVEGCCSVTLSPATATISTSTAVDSTCRYGTAADASADLVISVVVKSKQV